MFFLAIMSVFREMFIHMLCPYVLKIGLLALLKEL